MANAATSPGRTQSTRTVWILTAGAFFAFFTFGFVDNLKGPILPALLRELDFSYSQGGTLLLGTYVGFLIATLLAGVLTDVIGNKAILAVAGFLLTGGIFLFSISATFLPLAAAMALIGLGLGAIEVGGNALIVQLYDKRRGRFLNLLAVFHGAGSFIVPLFAAFLLAQQFSWRQVYQFTLVLTALMTLFFLFAKSPPVERSDEGGFDFALLRSTGFTSQMILYYTLITVYVAAEIGIAAWIVEFLQNTKGMSLQRSSIYLSLFFAAIMIGRLVGSMLVDRIGYLRVILIATVASILCLSIGIFGPPVLAIFIPLTGFFFSIIFPTATASVSHQHTANTGAILGVLFAFGGLGGALGPWAIGVASDWVGMQLGFALTIFYCVLLLGTVLALQRMATNPAK